MPPSLSSMYWTPVVGESLDIECEPSSVSFVKNSWGETQGGKGGSSPPPFLLGEAEPPPPLEPPTLLQYCTFLEMFVGVQQAG